MEFFQFHPTGLAGLGVLLSEAARGEGGILRNSDNERFMERYAPTIKDLAPRDMVARAMANEVREGRGAGPDKAYVYLDLTHLPREQIDAKLPDITEFARTYLGVEPYTEMIPVFPTAHYAMGGIPTNIKGEALADNHTVIPGLYAAGEVACVSVHGANRLGTNSLLDINVFGRRAGIYAAEYAASTDFDDIVEERPEGRVVDMIEQMRDAGGSERVAAIRQELQATMDINAQVYRTEGSLKQALADIEGLKVRYASVSVQDKGKRFNTDLLEAIELGFLLDLAEVLVVSALARNESRGGHFREDYPTRDDVNFMRHTMAYREPDGDGSPDPPRLQARHRDPLQADGAQVLMATDTDTATEAGAAPAQSTTAMTVTVKILRYNPEVSEESTWESYQVSAEPTDRVLDALHKVKWDIDGSLTFRRSCAHGVCGSDAMRINGKNRLACKTLLKDVNPSQPITVEPIKGLPVLKDLVVDMEPFFAAYRSVMPFLVTTGNEPTRERLQSQKDRDRFDDTTKCILCAACTTSCPVYWADGQYFGPQAIVGAHRFIFDSRDEGTDQRLEILNDKEGVWRCRTTFNCTEACPRGIEVTKAIQEVKRALIFRR